MMTYGLEPGASNSFESNSFRCRVNRWLPSEYFWSNLIRRVAFRSWFNWLWRSFSGKGLWVDQRNNSLVAAVKKRPGRCKYQPHQNVWGCVYIANRHRGEFLVIYRRSHPETLRG